MAPLPPEPADLPLTRPVLLAHLDREGSTPFEIVLTPQECAKTAAFLDLVELREMSFQGEVTGWGSDGWQANGDLSAIVAQACVVTLAPVTQYIEESVSRRYLPGIPIIEDAEIVVSEQAEDTPDPVTDTIDLAALMIESLVLALDPYPRAKGAELETKVFAAPGVEPMTDEDARPFAKLAALKEKLGDLS